MPQTGRTNLRGTSLSDAELARRQKIDNNPPECALASCPKKIPVPRRYSKVAKYCSSEHQREAAKVRKQQRQAVTAAQVNPTQISADLYPEHRVRRGALLTEITHTLDPAEINAWIEQRLPDVRVADRVGASKAAVGMARRAAWNDRILAAAGAAFMPADRHLRMLGPTDEDMRELRRADPDRFERMLDRLVDAFVAWRDEFFHATAEGTYLTKEVHRRWIRATLKTIYTGGRQLILSPPRHGKTDLLIHFCVWLIIRDPMIRILWVGPSDEIAQNSLGQVRNLLETHTPLVEAYLGPNHTWAPTRRGSGNLWQSTKFTVETRPEPRKQPTMWCTGVKSKILSIDADFIVVDDPADPDDSQTETGREKIDIWMKVKLLSRKMHSTGLAMISSRCHPNDLYAQFIDNPNWEVIIDRAHNGEVCGLDLFEDHNGDYRCILFPEMNPLDYLRLQHEDVGPNIFDMMYQNQPRPDGTMIFDVEIIKDRCLDRSRGLGLYNLPQPYRLVAGLDPAARGVQAAFLWAVRLPSFEPDYDPRDPRWKERRIESYYMVDMETQSAGGIGGAAQIMRDWFVRYGVELWYVEDNSYQKVFFDDPRIKQLQRDILIEVKPANSGGQTYDPQFGVSSLAPLYHEGKIVLPYGTPESQRKVNALLTQLTNFTGERAKKPGKSDILMASWFPFATVIKRWRRENRQSEAHPSHVPSFPDYVTSNTTMMPWEPTTYPGLESRN